MVVGKLLVDEVIEMRSRSTVEVLTATGSRGMGTVVGGMVGGGIFQVGERRWLHLGLGFCRWDNKERTGEEGRDDEERTVVLGVAMMAFILLFFLTCFICLYISL